jgi:hypothetical protein
MWLSATIPLFLQKEGNKGGLYIDLILRLSANSYKDLLNFSGQGNLSGQKT